MRKNIITNSSVLSISIHFVRETIKLGRRLIGIAVRNNFAIFVVSQLPRITKFCYNTGLRGITRRLNTRDFPIVSTHDDISFRWRGITTLLSISTDY